VSEPKIVKPVLPKDRLVVNPAGAARKNECLSREACRSAGTEWSSNGKKAPPKGGPLSPLLSNILLDELDKELEKRGHSFCRYADDCNIYVQSRRAGERVRASVVRFLETKLRLKVNREKCAVAQPWERRFLGFRVVGKVQPRLSIHPQSLNGPKTASDASLNATGA
jgi:hypothetical protein